MYCDASVIVFFKQKTAYEVRMSDWNSDVCSSDLPEDEARGAWKGEPRAAGTLNDIEARRDQRVAAERKNHRGRVQRAQSPEAGIFDAEVERRKGELQCDVEADREPCDTPEDGGDDAPAQDRKSTRLNSSH